MEIQIIKDFKQLKTMETAWKDLEHRSPARFYQSYVYNKTWCEVNPHLDLYILFVYHNAKLVAIAPFYLEKRKKSIFKWVELKFIGMGDYRNILYDPQEVNPKTIFHTIFSYLYEHAKDWDRLLLSYIEKDSALNFYILQDDKLRPYYTSLNENPVLDLRDKTFDDIKNHMPTRINKYRNRLIRDGGYDFSVEQIVSESLFQEISELHQEEQEKMRELMDRKERVSHYDDRIKNAFFKKLSEDKNSSVIFTLRQNGKLIFYSYCYQYRSHLYGWNLAYDVNYKNYSLSNTAFYEIFQYLTQEKSYQFFDFGAGSYPWKFRWADDYNPVYELDLWSTCASKMLRILYKIKK